MPQEYKASIIVLSLKPKFVFSSGASRRSLICCSVNVLGSFLGNFGLSISFVGLL